MAVAVYVERKRRWNVLDARTSKPYRGLWARVKASGQVVYEIKLKGRSVSLPEGTTERQAITEWKVMSGQSEKGKTVIPSGKVTLADVWAIYFQTLTEQIASGDIQPSTKTTAEINWRLHIEPTLGGKTPIAKVTADDMAAFYRTLRAKGLSANAQLTNRWLVNQLYKIAIRRGWAFTNPNTVLQKNELPKRENIRKSRIIRFEDTVAMIEVVSPTYRTMLCVLAATGLRISELCGLVWADVDFDRRTIEVRQQLKRDEQGGRVLGKTKSKNSDRTVVMLDMAYDALVEQLNVERAKGHGKPDDFVFTTASGAPHDPDNFRTRGVKAAARKAGLGNIVPHDLRHTTASMLVAADVPVTAAAKMMGHSVAIFWRDYAHAFEDERELQELREKLTAVGHGARLQLVEREVA